MVIYLAWFSKKKKRFIRRNRNLRRKLYRKTGTYRLMNNKYNRRYKVVGPTPDYFLSPIDAVPYIGPARKGVRGYKYTRNTARAAVGGVKAYSRRRGRKSSSPSGRRRRRGTYYYYRGKRIYRK